MGLHAFGAGIADAPPGESGAGATPVAARVGVGGRYLFENASFQLNAGQRYGLVGANGSGKTTGSVSFFHHDPYAQVFSKIVRGFRRDMEDAEDFFRSGMVDADRFREIVHGIPADAYAQYPALSQDAVLAAVDGFLDGSAR